MTTGSGEASRLLALLVKEWYTVYVPPLAWVTVLHSPSCQAFAPMVYPKHLHRWGRRHAVAAAEIISLRGAARQSAETIIPIAFGTSFQVEDVAQSKTETRQDDKTGLAATT